MTYNQTDFTGEPKNYLLGCSMMSVLIFIANRSCDWYTEKGYRKENDFVNNKINQLRDIVDFEYEYNANTGNWILNGLEIDEQNYHVMDAVMEQYGMNEIELAKYYYPDFEITCLD